MNTQSNLVVKKRYSQIRFYVHQIKICLQNLKIFLYILCIDLTIYTSERIHVDIWSDQVVGTEKWYFEQQDFVYCYAPQNSLKSLQGSNTQPTDDGYIAGLFHGFSYKSEHEKIKFSNIQEKKGLLVAKNVHELFVHYFDNNRIILNNIENDDTGQKTFRVMHTFLCNAFEQVNKKLKKQHAPLIWHNGATATIVYRLRNKLYIANAGHNRAIWGPMCADQTVDHKANNNNEKTRFYKSTLFKNCGTNVRLNDDLLMTRYFGYEHILPKIRPQSAVNPVPSINMVNLTESTKVIIGTHALWNSISEKGSEETFQENDNRFAYSIIEKSLKKHSIDQACLILIAAAICYHFHYEQSPTKCLQVIKTLNKDLVDHKQPISKEELKSIITTILMESTKDKIKDFVNQNKYNLDDNTTVIVIYATYKSPSITKKPFKPIITTRLMIRNAFLLLIAFYISFLTTKNRSDDNFLFIFFSILYAGMQFDNYLSKKGLA